MYPRSSAPRELWKAQAWKLLRHTRWPSLSFSLGKLISGVLRLAMRSVVQASVRRRPISL
jgi:hypothetical protein